MKDIPYRIVMMVGLSFLCLKNSSLGADSPRKTVPHEVRFKKANKPYNLARYFYFSVKSDDEEAFLKVYKERLAVRQHQVENGKYLWFGLFKARSDDFGANYVISVGNDSLQMEGGRMEWEVPHLPASFSAERWNETSNEINELREYKGSMIVALRDYTLDQPDGSKWPRKLTDIVLNIGYMKPASGKESLYRNLEQEIFQKVWQKRCENDPSFIAWGFHSVIADDLSGHDFDYMTTNISREDVVVSKEATDSLWEDIGSEVNKALKEKGVESMDDVRELHSVTYDLVMGTDGSKELKNQTRRQLLGTWIHKNKDGSYRKKVIGDFTEQLSFYDQQGKLVQQRKPWPMRIEIIDQQPRFTVYAPDGSSWNAAITVIEGRWYEQHRAVWNGNWTNSKPSDYWVYEKVD